MKCLQPLFRQEWGGGEIHLPSNCICRGVTVVGAGKKKVRKSRQESGIWKYKARGTGRRSLVARVRAQGKGLRNADVCLVMELFCILGITTESVKTCGTVL